MPLLIRTTGLDEYLDPSGGAYIKMLIMGEPGSGKTPSAAQWPKPIFADCEKGLASVARLKVPYATITSSRDMEDLLDHLRRDSLLPPERRKYQTFILDTIDTYQRVLIEERKRTERKESISGWADWGWLDGKMTQLIEALVNMKMNVIINMHVKDVEEGDDEARQLVKKAKLKGDIKDSIWQDFDLIGLMEKTYVMKDGDRVPERHIRWHSEPKFPNLRDRFNILPRFTNVDFTENDYLQIFNAIAESLDAVPESTISEEIEQEAEPDPASGLGGGPVDKPNLPRSSAPTKKAAAKKAAPAKKAAAPAKAAEPEVPASAPEAEVTPTPEPEAKPTETTKEDAEEIAQQVAVAQLPEGDPWASPNGKGTATEPIVLPATVSMVAESKAKESMEHVHSADGTCLKNTYGDPCHLAGLGTVTGVEPAAPEPEAAQPTPPAAPAEPKAAAPAAAGNVRHCGDQPASMAGRFPAVPGCGTELNQQNAARQQIAMLKKKTFLCDACHDAAA